MLSSPPASSFVPVMLKDAKVTLHQVVQTGGDASAGTPVRRCPELQTCIALSQMQIAENIGLLDVPGTPSSLVGAVGVCTGNIDAGYHMPNASAVPPPM